MMHVYITICIVMIIYDFGWVYFVDKELWSFESSWIAPIWRPCRRAFLKQSISLAIPSVKLRLWNICTHSTLLRYRHTIHLYIYTYTYAYNLWYVYTCIKYYVLFGSDFVLKMNTARIRRGRRWRRSSLCVTNVGKTIINHPPKSP